MAKIKTSNNLLRKESTNTSDVREDRILVGGKFYPVNENNINEFFIV